METWPSTNGFLEWTGFIPDSGRLLANLPFPYLFLGSDLIDTCDTRQEFLSEKRRYHYD